MEHGLDRAGFLVGEEMEGDLQRGYFWKQRVEKHALLTFSQKSMKWARRWSK